MSFYLKLDRLLSHFDDLKEQLSHAKAGGIDQKEFARLSKEYADIADIAEAILALKNDQKAILEADQMRSDLKNDADIREMADAEWFFLRGNIQAHESQIKLLLLPKDVDDERNAILEVRAGTGGDEAGLFAANLLRMYQRYAAVKGWRFELLSSNESGLGSIREASASISGKGVFARLKFESGVHRVQRVPETEASGRIHTSTATVAVLPEVEEVDVQIEDKDLLIDVFRASGAGGQHVNTTDSAVRITHLPTGVVVSQQDERSQHKNKAKAMKILRARLYELERAKKENDRAQARKTQIGGGERSERIRTYNFPQGRISDHRINLTLYKINQIMEGEALDELLEALIAHHQAELLGEEGGTYLS